MNGRWALIGSCIVAAALNGCGTGSYLQEEVTGAQGEVVFTTLEEPLEDGTKRVRDEAVGASLVIPSELQVENEGMTIEDTYGFTVWSEATPGDETVHSRRPLLRVARALKLAPEDIEARVEDRLAEFPQLELTRTSVPVGSEGLRGVAVGPIPGSTPNYEVYAAAANGVYRLQVYGEVIDEAALKRLASVKLSPPTVALSSLPLMDANSQVALNTVEDDALIASETDVEGRSMIDQELQASSLPDQPEMRIEEGCYRAPTRFYVQTQHGMYANRGRWAGRRAGWTTVGSPNFWGSYSHGSLGFGRCNRANYTNDKFAIDYPLLNGDVIFSPFRSGTVTFAGRNTSHRDYGIMVVIRSDNGKYYSLSGHLSGLARGIWRGARVTNNTIIGFAGATGGGRIPVGQVHLHQAFYRYPTLHQDGSPFGGQSLQVQYHRYFGSAAGDGGGVYKYGWSTSGGMKTRGSFISN